MVLVKKNLWADCMFISGFDTWLSKHYSLAIHLTGVVSEHQWYRPKIESGKGSNREKERTREKTGSK